MFCVGKPKNSQIIAMIMVTKKKHKLSLQCHLMVFMDLKMGSVLS